MTQKLTHDNPAIFKEPRSFKPERWRHSTERKFLEKYLQPFGRGSRACLGIQYIPNRLPLGDICRLTKLKPSICGAIHDDSNNRWELRAEAI